MELNFSNTGAPPPLAVIDRGCVALYYLFVLFIVIRDWKKLLYFLTANKILLLIVLLPLASVIWSLEPDVSLSRFYRVVLRSTIFGLYLASTYTLKELMRLLGIALGITVLLSLAVSLGMPSYGRSAEGGEWRGVFAHKNHLGRMMIFATSYFALLSVYIRKNRRMTSIFLLGAVLILLLCEAKSSLVVTVALFGLLPLYPSFRVPYRSKAFLQLLALIVGIFMIVGIASLANYVIVEILGKDPNLNGRGELWGYLLAQAAKRPLLGYGYEGFWNNPEQRAAGYNYVVFFPSHAHSGFVDLLLQFGAVGFVLFALCSFMTLYRILKLIYATHSIEHFWMLLLMIGMIGSQYSVGNTILKDHLFWILYISTATSAVVELRRIHRNQQVRESQTPTFAVE